MPMTIQDQKSKGAESRGGGGGGGGLSPAMAIAEGVSALLSRLMSPILVRLPSNLFVPEGSESFDIDRLVSIPAGTTDVVLEYTAEESQTVRFIKYGIFTNVVLGQNARFIPSINGNRILKYHGDPKNDFAIYLSVGPDLTENSLRLCDVVLNAGQTIKWTVKNMSGASADFGVRMRGYLINKNSNSGKFGG